jgi:1H-pyrrole-2-carbonyl-[peptidyl-carrier protein] chlorinase
MSQPDFEVGILGGGPAGSSLAAYLAMQGVNCVLLEKELFPRPHVGESLVPSSTRVFKDLNFLPKLEEARFPRKYGAAWNSQRGGVAQVDWEGLAEEHQVEKVDVRFAEREQEGVDQLYTYHVDRGQFDLLLLQHAHSLGARVCEGLRVEYVDFDDGPLPRIRARLGKKEIDFRVRVVVDATGRNTLLGRQLKLRVTDPVFDQFAVHSWWEGFDRGDSAQSDFIFIHFLPMHNTWVWQIPITDAITSFGVVTQKKNFAKSRKSREDFFWKCMGTRAELHEGLRKAEQIRPFKDEGDYSYAMRQLCGDRFLLIGDAGRFVDPIFSSGVSLALNSARLSQRDILAALESGDFRRESFADYETAQRRGTRNWYKFITVYYRLNILFTYFLSNAKYRLDILKLLQGDVYDEEEPQVLRKMREAVCAAEDDPGHPWHNLLNDLTANAFKEAW